MSYFVLSDICNPHTNPVKDHLLALNKAITAPERFNDNLTVSKKPKYRVTQPLERNTTKPRTWRLIRYAYTEYSEYEYFVEVPSFDIGVYKDKGFYAGIHLGKHAKFIKPILGYVAEHVDEYISLLQSGFEFTIGEQVFDCNSGREEFLKALSNKDNYDAECYCRVKIDYNCSNKELVHSVEEVLGNELLFDSLCYGRKSA